MTQPAYAELHAHSNFSFLDGASHPEEMAARAAELGLTALAITDHDGVYGAVRFSHAAREHGLRPIVGMEASLSEGRHLTLLARDREGYANICRLATAAHRDRPKGTAELDLDTLARHTRGLVGLSGCLRGAIPNAALNGDDRQAIELAGTYAELFEPGGFFLELQDHRLETEHLANAGLLDVARRTGLPLAATNNVHYHDRSRARLQDVLVCIKHTATLETAGRRLRPNHEFVLKSASEMARLFAGVPEAVGNTLRIAEMCDFDLSRKLEYGLPTFPTPSGESEYGYMERLVWEGARRRYPDLDEAVCERVRRELRYVKDLRLAGYFLTVRDLVDFCHRHDILVNTRGSAPGSILCYALGISMVDPIAAGLMFERFMSPDRDEPPDIDLDIEHQERERVIQYVYERYGRRRAAMVANVICFRGRSAIRDVGKALGLPQAQVDRLAERLQWHPSVEMPHPDQAGGDVPREVSNRVGRDLLELSRQIVDFPRHLGIHTGGMIIASHPLDGSVPIEPATMEGRTVAQWDKDDCADTGLLKIDLLGLGMLTLIQRAFRLIERRHGRRLALADFSFDDPEVYDAICAADTIGMFQVESRAQMHVLPQTRPRCFYDLVVQVAIIRPGPMTTKMHRRWILRRTGQEADDPVWPGLASVLQRTLGLPIFQEQCLQIAMVAAGFSATKADALRRAMSRKRSLAHIQALQEDLMQGMTRSGIPAATAEQIYAQIEGYAGYGFPEAHSCAFALLVYVSAWLKVHHHAEFTCAILNSQPMGFYSPHTLVGDAQRHGVTVRPVDIRHSRFECMVEPDGAVRMGYQYVEGLGEAHRERLDEASARGPYRSLEDFCRRTRLPINVLEALATAGAFRGLGLNRRAALWQVQAHAPAAHGGELPNLVAELEEPVALPPADALVQVRMDFAATGLSTRWRGLEFLRPALAQSGVLRAADLLDLAAKRRARPDSAATVKARPTRIPRVAIPAGVRPPIPRPRRGRGRSLHPPAVGRYGERARRTGNHYDGQSSGRQFQGLGDSGVPDALREQARTGVMVTVAGIVINRQHPPTARGYTFLSLEDETGLVNIIIRPSVFTRYQRAILDSPVMLVYGEMQDEHGAVQVMAHTCHPATSDGLGAPPSRDWS
ncbi:MAG: error-prone DNA polymerase [Chloroflexi bacterium]|nr:error-prone DNA polymerase [Chloroflexota bacterium]